MVLNLRNKGLVVVFLILLVGATTMHPKEGNSNYYLGVLAKGYPASLVAGELRYANAQVVGMTDSMVLFGINEKTQLTTFLKNLPFLAEVYVDAEEIKGKDLLKKNPLAREFISLSKGARLQPGNPGQSKDITTQKTLQTLQESDKQTKITRSTGNMALIDKLIREKAKATRIKKSGGK